jgi:hypothetical protein
VPMNLTSHLSAHPWSCHLLGLFPTEATWVRHAEFQRKRTHTRVICADGKAGTVNHARDTYQLLANLSAFTGL